MIYLGAPSSVTKLCLCDEVEQIWTNEVEPSNVVFHQEKRATVLTFKTAFPHYSCSAPATGVGLSSPRSYNERYQQKIEVHEQIF